MKKILMVIPLVFLLCFTFGNEQQVENEIQDFDLVLKAERNVVGTESIPGWGVGEGTQHTVSYITQKAIRMSYGNSEVILLLADRKIIMLLHSVKSYTSHNVDEYGKLQAAARAAWKKSSEKMMRERYRADRTGIFILDMTIVPLLDILFQKMYQKMKKVKEQFTFTEPKVTHQGPGGTVAGYDTERYSVQLAQGIKYEVWAAKDLQMPQWFYDFQRAGYGASMDSAEKSPDPFSSIKGLWLKSVGKIYMPSGDITIADEVTEVEKTAIPPSTFEIPVGYKQIDPFRGMPARKK